MLKHKLQINNIEMFVIYIYVIYVYIYLFNGICLSDVMTLFINL